jgi:hypothetical protein
MSDARPRAIVTSLALVACLGAAFGACTSYQSANGENCLKNADCLTNYCQAQVCASPPAPLNGSSYEEGGVSEDTGTAADTSTPETSTPADSASDVSTGG